MNTGNFNIQCKAVENMGSAHNALDYMKSKMRKVDAGKHNVVFHKKNRQGVVVSMYLDDFILIIKQLKH